MVYFLFLASVAFINNGKKIGLLPNKCNHSELLGDFFGQSCAPGATDSAHDFDSVRENLCSLCPHTRSGGISAVQSVAPAHSEQSSSYKPLGRSCKLTKTHTNSTSKIEKLHYIDTFLFFFVQIWKHLQQVQIYKMNWMISIQKLIVMRISTIVFMVIEVHFSVCSIEVMLPFLDFTI